MKVILASSSPRRAELMEYLDIPFEIICKNTDERYDKHQNCYENCMLIAQNKAQAVFDEIDEDVIVIGSDTIVSFNNQIYGKPKNLDEAFLMLNTFSGQKHEVISSICLLIRKNGQVYKELDYDKCDVYVEKMSNQEIKDWISKHDVLTRAGGYAIQDGFGKYIKKVDGDYFSIVGFPLHKVYELLKKYL